MKTVWGENIDKTAVLQEYPRPQLVRDSYVNINGEWDYIVRPITKKNDLFSYENTGSLPFSAPHGKILVPFSPECELSGIDFHLTGNELFIYQYKFHPTKSFNRGRILLHLDAVDSCCAVFVNGSKLTEHIGGYWPVICDITDYVTPETVINVCVYDAQDSGFLARGKQRIENRGIWYTAQSGIWQSAWIESVPKCYIESVKITPDFDTSSVEITVNTNEDCNTRLILAHDGSEYETKSNTPFVIKLHDVQAWSPETPYLYYFTVQAGDDEVKSYFAMRKFSVDTDKDGIKRLFLNGKPYFHNGLLDQGYYSDGLMTPPSDKAMICDIMTMKELGFNMLRKHIKIEPLRWYYHCDRLGMLVWQDMVCGGDNIRTPDYTGEEVTDGKENYALFGRLSEENRKTYYRELEDTVNLLYNSPCIAMWVPFNEGWGQFDSLEAVRRIRDLDNTRCIDHASGWHDRHGSDVQSVHVYCRPYVYEADKYERAVVLSEFGGYNLAVEGHLFAQKQFGYVKTQTRTDLEEKLTRLYEDEIIPAKALGLSAAVYTQLSDVEGETNGLFTYDRRVLKVSKNVMLAFNKKLSDN